MGATTHPPPLGKIATGEDLCTFPGFEFVCPLPKLTSPWPIHFWFFGGCTVQMKSYQCPWTKQAFRAVKAGQFLKWRCRFFFCVQEKQTSTSKTSMGDQRWVTRRWLETTNVFVLCWVREQTRTSLPTPTARRHWSTAPKVVARRPWECSFWQAPMSTPHARRDGWRLCSTQRRKSGWAVSSNSLTAERTLISLTVTEIRHSCWRSGVILAFLRVTILHCAAIVCSTCSWLERKWTGSIGTIRTLSKSFCHIPTVKWMCSSPLGSSPLENKRNPTSSNTQRQAASQETESRSRRRSTSLCIAKILQQITSGAQCWTRTRQTCFTECQNSGCPEIMNGGCFLMWNYPISPRGQML